MSRKFLVSPRLPAGSTNPATGNEGDLWFNTTEDAVYVYDGAAWVRNGVPSGGTAGQILSKTDGTNYNTQWIDNYTTDVRQIVKNDSGVTLAKGTVVYVSGANGSNVLVKPAQATADSESVTTIGFLLQSLAANGIGFVITEGLIGGINTAAATAGDPVWLSPTTPGGVVYGIASKPSAPNHLVYLGIVSRAHAVNGEILVTVNNGWELDELHNVSITSPSTGQVLTYDAVAGYWKNAAVSATNVYDYSALDGGDQVSRIELAEITGGWISQTADGGTP